MRKLGRVGLCVSSLALLYCLSGILMTGSFSATPNFPRERTARNLMLWGTLTVVSLVMLCASFVIWRRAKRKRD